MKFLTIFALLIALSAFSYEGNDQEYNNSDYDTPSKGELDYPEGDDPAPIPQESTPDFEESRRVSPDDGGYEKPLEDDYQEEDDLDY